MDCDLRVSVTGVILGTTLGNDVSAAFWTSWPKGFLQLLPEANAGIPVQWPWWLKFEQPSLPKRTKLCWREVFLIVQLPQEEMKAIKPQLKMVCVTWNGQCGWISGWSFLKWLIFPGAFHTWATRLHSHFRGDASPKVTQSQSEEAALCWYLLGSCRRNRCGVYPWFSGTGSTFIVAFPMFPTSVGGSEGCLPLIIQGRSPWVGMLFESPLGGVSQWLPSR